MPFYQTNKNQFKSYYDIVYYENIYWPAHFHNNFEVILLLEGELTVYDEEKIYRLTPEKALFLFPNHIHSIDKRNDTKCYICSFSPDYVPAFMNLVKDKYIADTTFKIDSHLLNFLIYQFKRKFTLSPLEIKGLSYVICSTFLEQATFSPKKNTNADLLQKMLNYILQNYTSDVSLKSMSQALGYEEHYLSRCFHKHFTFNFKDFINQLRVSESKKLLQGTNLSVTEISYRCGFNSIRNFNRNFLRECGVSPQVYRKSLK